MKLPDIRDPDGDDYQISLREVRTLAIFTKRPSADTLIFNPREEFQVGTHRFVVNLRDRNLIK